MTFLAYYVLVTKYLPGKTHKQNSNQRVLTQILKLKGDTIWHFVAPTQSGFNLIMLLHWTCMSDYVKNETRTTLYLTFFFSLNCIEAKWFCLNIIKKGSKATKFVYLGLLRQQTKRQSQTWVSANREIYSKVSFNGVFIAALRKRSCKMFPQQ